MPARVRLAKAVVVTAALLLATVASTRARAADVAPAWEFSGPSTPSPHRLAVDRAGSIYVSDADGLLYALDPAGAVRWTYDAVRASGAEAGDSGEGPVVLGDDGTVYLAFNPAGPLVELHAIGPEGENRWTFRLAALNTIAGPAVGPDGNLYVAHAESGRGLLVLDPTGRLVRSNPGTPVLQDRSSLGSELVFGPREAGEPATQLYLALDQYRLKQFDAPASLFGFDLTGQQRFSSGLGKLAIAGGQRQGQPAVGPSGTVYVSTTAVGQGWGVHAFSPEDGRPLWSWYEVPGNTLTEPAVGPDETVYVVQNTANLVAIAETEAIWSANLEGFVQHGPVLHPDGNFLVVLAERGDELVVLARDARTGSKLWDHHLPRRDGERLAPTSRVSFSPDGARLLVQTEVLGGAGGWRLYALDIARCPAGLDDCSVRVPRIPVIEDGPPTPPPALPDSMGPPTGSTAQASIPAAQPSAGCSSAGMVPAFGPFATLLVALRLRRRSS